ncbi:hypothetical protein AX769_17000 [Frondihabitans sp. PAMC 28766]|uniref:C40 family peptidase n=1 Tax=Frondihabitans sp. PAMC 28766 TaxID=1795630 RepID=UPI00078D7507|nr:NlpC/P60 family protein [Frondihabitans sp. PAMC 28766]AMM21528.1 hypothetical protein AX769_17000 [Frondihabitans sp. PAMC 28766]
MTARHRATPVPRGRHAVHHISAPTAAVQAGGLSFRCAVVSSSAVVAVAGLSISMILPAEAATLHSTSHARQTTAHVHAAAQSFTVPSTVAVDQVARDDYTATPPAVLAAAEAAKARALKVSAPDALTKAAAIAAILAAPVTVVTYSAAATAAAAGTTAATTAATPSKPGATASTSTTTTDTALSTTGVTTVTSGTVADKVAAATLDSASATADEIVAAAVKYVGVVPYVHDGADPKTGFDCSGLVMYVYAKFGIAVPHDVDGIAALGTPIAADKVQPGDLVVYPHQHIGIYIGDGYMVDAPNVGRDVEVQAVWGKPTYVHVAGA